ncbi:HNH endonuclease signature motif containing protein [Actinomycetospora cinnamomea]
MLPPRRPHTADALAHGRIAPAHVAVIRRTISRLERVGTVTPHDLADCERILAEAAAGLPPRMLQKVAQRLIDELDPDGAAPPDGEDRFDELRLVRRRDGSLAIKGRIRDPLDAEMMVEVFDLLSAPAGPHDDRDKPCRTAGALKDMVQDVLGAQGLATDSRREHAATDPEHGPETEPETEPERPDEGTLFPTPGPSGPPPDAGRQPTPGRSARRALLTITMDHRWLCAAVGHGTLASGAPVDAQTVRRWACDAEIVPMVLGTRSVPLDVGRASRTVTESIRRALDLRDGGCAFPGCSRRPRRCHAHHVRHWLDDGPTCLDNLVLLCRFHHKLIHHGYWIVEILGGLPWFTPPPWVDPHQHRRPGGRRLPVPRS